MWVTSGSLNDTLGAFSVLGGVVSWWEGGRIGSACGMGSSKVLPLLSVIALAFSLGFINGWEGSLLDPCATYILGHLPHLQF